MSVVEFAPAKINLFLHVGAPRADGRHPVCSLAVFADVGDRLEMERASAASLTVEGPFAQGVGPERDNLVTRALAAAAAPVVSVRLEKSLPTAAGLGGGSSDAGAALRAAMRLEPSITPERAAAAARGLGADGLLCFVARASVCEGEGEILSPAPILPEIPAVLVNPGVPSPTGAVYRAYDEGGGAFTAERPDMPQAFSSVEALAAFLEARRNDLEAPAVRLEPRIGEALEAVRAAPGTLMGRMSGSGATVFALCASHEAAQGLAGRLAADHPGWWVRACRLA